MSKIKKKKEFTKICISLGNPIQISLKKRLYFLVFDSVLINLDHNKWVI